VSLFQQGKQALVVGGTGLYIRVLTRGLFPAPPADPELREELKKKEEKEGKGYLHRELEKVDPEAALRIHLNDTFRTIRALEIFYLTGTSISLQHQNHQFKESPFNVLKIGLLRNREAIYHRIEERVDTMLSSGLLEEVQHLLKKGYPPTIKPFHSLGYKQILGYLQGTTSLEEAVEIIKRNTKRYAKRQLTWFRKDTEIEWFTLPRQSHEIGEAIRKFLKI
jgi:tRNA dimethylallyltransferase